MACISVTVYAIYYVRYFIHRIKVMYYFCDIILYMFLCTVCCEHFVDIGL